MKYSVMCFDSKGHVSKLWNRYWYNKQNALIHMVNMQACNPDNVYYIKESLV